MKILNRKMFKMPLGTKVSYSSSGYILYHQSFSDAIQHALTVSSKKGYPVSDHVVDDRIGLGVRKPSCNETNSYILPTNKKAYLYVQIANLDDKHFELNMYID
tara:strand:- start:1320 stop:1628 length:309 start_codon:yes stop_codon:yes gene_type:complete